MPLWFRQKIQAVPRPINVAAGILLDGNGRVLITERTGNRSFAGLWEFPGGKLKDGEKSVAALHRELNEELGIEVLEQSFYMSIEHDYPDRSVSIDFYLVGQWQKKPAGKDGQALKWISPVELSEEMLLPADGPVLAALKRL